MNQITCSTCHSVIPENAPGGFCPACLLRDAEESPPIGHAAPSTEQIAAVFPQWEIMGLIGQGGMGFVYEVRQPSLDRTVALKILSPELSRDPAFAERFAREARTLGKLNHPNIVTVFEHGEKDGFFYLLMEYVDGVNLRQAMRAGRFTPQQALTIVPGICDALQYAHDQGVWHRDIKPENILLDRDGKVKIADFGIARIMGDPRHDFTLTMTGNALGSAAYMAPEQHEKPHDVDHRADIYSLGVVIYEMLTGELPLGRFPSPSQRTDVDARIDEIVLKTLEKERELRQQSATEVKTDMQGAQVASTEGTPAMPRNSHHFSTKRLFLLSAGMICGGTFVWLTGMSMSLQTRYDTAGMILGILARLLICSGLITAAFAIHSRKPSAFIAGVVSFFTLAVVFVLGSGLMNLLVIIGLWIVAGILATVGLRTAGPPNTKFRSRQSTKKMEKSSSHSGSRQLSGSTASFTTQADDESSVTAAATFPDLPFSLSMWIGGLCAVPAGLYTSPLITGLGLVAAALGLLGCGWILWNIKNGKHTTEHRLPLLILVYWPVVIGLTMLASATWFSVCKRGMEAEQNGIVLAVYGFAILAIAAPWIIGRLLWVLFGQSPAVTGTGKFGKTPLIMAILFIVGCIVLVKFVCEREMHYDSYRYSYIQLLHDIRWPEDESLVQEAVAKAVGEQADHYRIQVFGPGNTNIHPRLREFGSPVVMLETTLRNDSATQHSKAHFTAITARLNAILPNRIDLNAQGVYAGCGAPDSNPELRQVYREVRPWNAVLMIAPALIVLLSVASRRSFSWTLPIVALVVGGCVAHGPNFPRPSALPPSIDGLTPLAMLPDPEYDLSTPKDAIQSIIKAAKRNDLAAYKLGISRELLEKTMAETPDFSEQMRDDAKASYDSIYSQGEGFVRVRVRVENAEGLAHIETVPMILEEGNWKISMPETSNSATTIPQNHSQRTHNGRKIPPPVSAPQTPSSLPATSVEEVFRKVNAAANESNGEEFEKHTKYFYITPDPIATSTIQSGGISEKSTLKNMKHFLGEIVKLRVVAVERRRLEYYNSNQEGTNPVVYATIRKSDGSLRYYGVSFYPENGKWVASQSWMPNFRASSRIEFKPAKGDALAILKTHMVLKSEFRLSDEVPGHFHLFGYSSDADTAKNNADKRVSDLRKSLDEFDLGQYLQVMAPAEKPDIPYLGEYEPPYVPENP